MTTKEQERQAIEKIRKIVEGLGADSYVGTAMAGVLEVAEQNIEFDAAFSLKVQAELAEKEAAQMKETVEQQEKELKELRERLEMKNEVMESAAEEVERRRMPRWMYDRIETMAGAEGRRLEREKEELAAEYRHNSAERQELERFQQVFKKKYEEDFLNG